MVAGRPSRLLRDTRPSRDCRRLPSGRRRPFQLEPPKLWADAQLADSSMGSCFEVAPDGRLLALMGPPRSRPPQRRATLVLNLFSEVSDGRRKVSSSRFARKISYEPTVELRTGSHIRMMSRVAVMSVVGSPRTMTRSARRPARILPRTARRNASAAVAVAAVSASVGRSSAFTSSSRSRCRLKPATTTVVVHTPAWDRAFHSRWPTRISSWPPPEDTRRARRRFWAVCTMTIAWRATPRDRRACARGEFCGAQLRRTTGLYQTARQLFAKAS
jgi:hypothetical protein